MIKKKSYPRNRAEQSFEYQLKKAISEGDEKHKQIKSKVKKIKKIKCRD